MHKDPLSSFFQDDAAYKIDCHDRDVSFSDGGSYSDQKEIKTVFMRRIVGNVHWRASAITFGSY